jgi:hypothetical protein
MAGTRYVATILRNRKTGIYHIRVWKTPEPPGPDEEIVENLNQKPNETEEGLKKRAIRYVQSLPQ